MAIDERWEQGDPRWAKLPSGMFFYLLMVIQLAAALDGAKPKRCLKMREKWVGFSKPRE